MSDHGAISRRDTIVNPYSLHHRVFGMSRSCRMKGLRCLPHDILLHIILMMFTPFIIAQPPQHTLIRKQEGLNNNTSWTTNSVHIDTLGFVWIATQSGLNRYDGYGVRSYNGTGQLPYDLPYNKISALAQDERGIFWLGTQEEGIITFNPYLESFARFDSRTRLPDSVEFGQINRLAFRRKGVLLIGTAFQGLYEYHMAEDKLRQIKIDPENISSRSINNFFVRRNERVIVLAYNGLYLEMPDQTFRHIPIDPAVFLSDAIEQPDGQILIYTTNTTIAYRLDPESGRLTPTSSPDEKIICDCLIDPNGRQWTNTYGGLFREDPDTHESDFYSFSTDILDHSTQICIKDMAADRNGHIYYMSLATGAGRWRYDDFPVTTILPFGYNKLVYRNDALFLLTDHELLEYTNGNLRPVPLVNKPDAPIFDFFFTQNGEYWVTFYSEVPRIHQYSPDGRLLHLESFARASTQFLELNDGQITNASRLHSIEKKLPVEFIGSIFERISGKAYPDFKVKYYTQLQNGEVWMATFASGILRLTESLTAYEFMEVDPAGNGQLNSNNPYYIFESGSGHVFVSTDKGINIWDPVKHKYSYILGDNMELQEIIGMGEGVQGEVWMLLPTGLWRYTIHDSMLATFSLHPDFRPSIGAPSDLQFDEEGHLYYLASAGVVRVNTEELEKQEAPNTILFTDLFVKRNRVFPGDGHAVLDSAIMYQHSLELPFKHRDIGFSFVSPHGHEVNTSYYYRLVGYQEEWSKAPADRTIHYTSLSPGEYRFEVKGQSGHGKWTAVVSGITFHIAAPWYQQGWAYILYALIASTLAYGFYRYRVNELLKYQALRTKISSDLHDDVGTILGSIAMESEMLSYEIDPVKKPLLERLSHLSREAMGRMRDTVWAIDSRKDNLEFLTDRMKDYLAETLGRSRFSYNFENRSDVQNRPLSPDVRQNVYLIFKEAINNILKHSNGHAVQVLFTQTRSGFEIEIRDDGQVTQPLPTSGLGLSNMKLRAEMIHADLSVDTKDGFGIRLRFET